MSYEIQPLRSDEDHTRALDEIARLWDAEPGTPEGDRLEVLGILVDVYEREHHPIDPTDPVEAIRFRLEQQGLPTSALATILGSKARASEVLNRKRGLSLAMIRAIHAELGVPTEVLIREIPPAERRAGRVGKKTASRG